MKHTFIARFVAAVASLILLLLAGCQRQEQQDLAPGEKQARLIAAENMDLRKRLADQQTQIKTLQQQHAKELERRDQELARCKALNDQLQKDLEEGIAQRVKEVTATVVTENVKLREQIKELQTRIERLKAQPQPSDPSQQVP